MNKITVSKLRQLTNAIIDEAKQNQEFAKKLEKIFVGGDYTAENNSSNNVSNPIRPANRRDPAVLDPISLIEDGKEVLAARLNTLTDKQLKDIIAEYGMDSARLAMKWKDREKLINLIIDVSVRRASKGDAFRK